MRPSRLAALLERELAAPANARTPVMLWGPPGVGKSRIVADLAARHRLALVDIRLAQLEPTDLRGIPFRDGRLVVWSVPAMLPDEARDGLAGVFFLDELTSAVPTVTAAAYQLILDRRLGEYRLPSGWIVVAAGNRQGDRGVTYQMPAPLANRFVHYELEPDLDDWVSWAHGQGIDERVIAFLRFRPDLLFDFDPQRHHAAFPSPRSWEFASRAVAKFDGDEVLLGDALKACVGTAAGLACRAFLDHLGRLPDPAAIAAGAAADLPRTVELQYAIAAALARHGARLPREAQDRAVPYVLAYARRFPQRELGAMLVMDLQRVLARPLIGFPQFADWAEDVAALIGFERA